MLQPSHQQKGIALPAPAALITRQYHCHRSAQPQPLLAEDPKAPCKHEQIHVAGGHQCAHFTAGETEAQ